MCLTPSALTQVFQVESSLRSELVERIGNQLADKVSFHSDGFRNRFWSCTVRPSVLVN